MGKTKHEKSFVNFEQGYEQNIIGSKGVIYFGVGIFLLLVVTFALMWVLQNVLEDNAVLTKDQKSPMMKEDKERLPPEPRLQAAPGFGVETDKGRVNLELKAPQSEYRELRKMWENHWANGQKDEKTGTVVTLGIEDAKKKYLQGVGEQPKSDVLEKAEMYISDSSAGRLASEKRR